MQFFGKDTKKNNNVVCFFDFFSVLCGKFCNFAAKISKNSKMSIISKLFGRKSDEQQKAGGMEDFMTLVRVYFQASMASDLGITNLAALPDLRV